MLIENDISVISEIKINGDIVYTYKNYYNCPFQGGKGSSSNKGYAEANDCQIRIRYADNSTLDVKDFKIGDIIAVGTLNETIESIEDLNGYEYYYITAIKDNKNTKKIPPHIHLSGK